MSRITVIMPEETYNKVVEQAEKEKRKKSSMCAILIDRGLTSYQERISNEMEKK